MLGIQPVSGMGIVHLIQAIIFYHAASPRCPTGSCDIGSRNGALGQTRGSHPDTQCCRRRTARVRTDLQLRFSGFGIARLVTGVIQY
ncbi:hypothetical protein D3C71_1510640 [compost metagenome]